MRTPVAIAILRTPVAIAILVGAAHAQFVAKPANHSGAQQGGPIASAKPAYGDQKGYESWVREYRQSSLETVDGIDPSGHTIAVPALLRITPVEGDDLPNRIGSFRVQLPLANFENALRP